MKERLREEQLPSPKEIKEMRERRRTPIRSRTDKLQPGSAKDIAVVPSKELLKPAK
jgi:hypothetical protein